ncbi:hypothetical protein DSM110093_03869 (plasmid) [Sulfitobacter sp. DSM 110093]|uniref:DUF3100 domain-containing protein n=1 Tax=Sulfitobacter sp. DSM 110093 TaxID=2883127 RepID=UPI001FAC3AC0|nr:DUF3100 domain-containing protein [Sulfitobacter sp. DSM 110093]UOA33773.1 hypothetical protein DSM110093_03608 [Sulfitobacter sp. DSM 110093]UOA34034.1 hypothetical protein DSM110093_03869 [Sulfitobacter sp. DSM 110093]
MPYPNEAAPKARTAISWHALTDWRLHVGVAVITILAELVGIIQIPIGIGSILLLPLFYSFILGLLLNPQIIKWAASWTTPRQQKAASSIILISILPFMAKFGTIIGPAMNTIYEAGPALILQEIGNLGTVVLALPLAVIMLGMGREAIGACFSVAREPNIGVIAEKYGLKSAEGTGVLGVYVVGTLVGTFIFAILASLFGSLGLFDPAALAMACGVGSGSMMLACTGSLTELFPDRADELAALAGASNLMTYATGLYVCIFVALPLCNILYPILKRVRP